MLMIKGKCPECRESGIHKSGCKRVAAGFVADDVKEIDPEMVRTNAAEQPYVPKTKTLECIWKWDRLKRLRLTLTQAFSLAELHEKKTLGVAENTEPKPERIYTRCPSCGFSTLVVNKGHLLCTLDSCRDPTLIDNLYDKKGS